MSRGRIIFTVIAELRPFVAPNEQDPDFKEPVLSHSRSDEPGKVPSSEGPAFRLSCQVEADERDVLNMQPNGEAPRTKLNLIFHVRDIKAAKAMPKRRDRLVALYSKRGDLLLSAEDGGALHAVEVRPMSFGMGRNSVANLLRVTFRDRARGMGRGA